MNTKFTPGPWAIYQMPNYKFGIDSGDEEVVECHTHGADNAISSEANAHLIAAAPLMYNLLDQASSLMFSSTAQRNAICDQMLNILAKARGEQ